MKVAAKRKTPAKKKAAPKKAVKKLAKKAVKKSSVKKLAKKAIKKAIKKLVKKSPAKKSPAKKPALKKSAAKKPAKKLLVKKSVAKKSAAKKPAAKKHAKKLVAKKPAKKLAVKKPALRKATIAMAPLKPVYHFEGPATEQVKLILAALDDAKAENTLAINIAGRSAMADAMIITTGRVNRHVSAIADQLHSKLKTNGYKNIRMEGHETGDWCLVDTGDVIIHIFRPEVRSFYNLEKLWSADAPKEQV